MRSLVALEYVSVDGVAQAPGHSGEDTDGGFSGGGWTEPQMPDHRRYGAEFYRSAGAFLFGRRTYEIWLEYWPNVTDPQDDIAAALNGKPKYVVSSRLKEVTWGGTTIIRDKLAEAVDELKQQNRGDILVPGSALLVQTLSAMNLIDRYHSGFTQWPLATGNDCLTDAPTSN